MNTNDIWPELNYEQSKDSWLTLHLFTQLVGKIKLAGTEWLNHSWHVTLRISPRGLTTGKCQIGNTYFQIDFDLLEHQLLISSGSQKDVQFPIDDMSVADFYKATMDGLKKLGIQPAINTTPNEMVDPTPFEKDNEHKTYNKQQITALHSAWRKVDKVFEQFRSRFSGKCSPVHFFWGGFDIAVTRFSGRPAPAHPGGVPNMPDWVARDAYSHEVSSSGFWPGNEAFPQAAFYNYIYPEPDGFKNSEIKNSDSYYHAELGEFILTYDTVRKAEDPEAMLMEFLQDTYDNAANLADWDIDRLSYDISKFK